jgi:putative endonuclease
LKKELWYVYIAECSDGTFYTGITNDIKRREKEHNTSDIKGARYTRTRRPVHVVYHEERCGRGEATIREREIKKMKKETKIKLASDNAAAGEDSL